MAKVHKVTFEEIEALIAEGMTREEAEFALIDKYEEVVFPDEADDINDKLKEQKKIAHVYDKKKGPRKVERKPDEDKRDLMAKIIETFGDYDSFQILTQEGKVKFKYNNRTFTITLTWNRKEDKT